MARSWLPILLRPHTFAQKLMRCFAIYEAETWDPLLESYKEGTKLAWDMLIPTLLLGLWGARSSPSSMTAAIGGVDHESLVRTLSPYLLVAPWDSPATSSTSAGILPTMDPSLLLRFYLLSLLSPVPFHILSRHFLPICRALIVRLAVVFSNHRGPDRSASNELAARVSSGRVVRRHDYDLFLPPPTTSLPEEDANGATISRARSGVSNGALAYGKAQLGRRNMQRVPALLFFPGYGIHHAAYASVASRLSDAGITVAVVSLEPFRLAHDLLGAGMKDVLRLIALAGRDVVRHRHGATHNQSVPEVQPVAVEWALGGHSMGGYAALQLGEELLRMRDVGDEDHICKIWNDGSIARLSNQLVIWGAGTLAGGFPRLVDDSPSSDRRSSRLESIRTLPPLSVLILLASNDPIASLPKDKGERMAVLSKLPRDTTVLHTIEGGNHGGFASYKDSGFDGPRDIPLEVQHVEACSQTVRFLSRW